MRCKQTSMSLLNKTEGAVSEKINIRNIMNLMEKIKL